MHNPGYLTEFPTNYVQLCKLKHGSVHFFIVQLSALDEAHLWQSVTFLASCGVFSSVNIVPYIVI